MSVGVGMAGMLCILTAFVLDEFSKWNQETVQYNLLNILGGLLLVWYALTLNSWPFIILNGVWVAAAGVKCGKILQK